MKIAFYSISHENLPSVRFRVLPYLKIFESEGYSVDLFLLPASGPGRILQAAGLLRQAFVRWRQLRKIKNYDLVIVQKGLTPWRCRWLLRLLTGSGVPYLLDIDDAVYRVQHERLPFFLRWLQDEAEPVTLIRNARRVIAGNSTIENSVRKMTDRVVLLPTVIETDRYTPSPQPSPPKGERGNFSFPLSPPGRGQGEGNAHSKVVIGWSGITGTNIYVNLMPDILRPLAKKYSFTFLVISDSLKQIDTVKFTGLDFQFLPWSAEEEVRNLQKMDIGIMPLLDDEWSKSKCGLKALLYMSVGIPAVCSPVGVNNEIIQDGVNGFLAGSSEEWIQKLGVLIENTGLRRQMGAKARKTVEEKYSVKANAAKWLKVIEEALDQRRPPTRVLSGILNP